MKGNILITGSSSGLGSKLCSVFYQNGYSVCGVSRSKTHHSVMHSEIADFGEEKQIKEALKQIPIKEYEYVFLNAGTLEPIDKLKNISVDKFSKNFMVNVLSSKVILDTLIKENVSVKNVVAISSGASSTAYDGLSLYCIAKAAFRQMISCYALENPDMFFLSLAPGVIKTKMQDYILTKDAKEFSSLKKFHDMYDTLPSSVEIANKIYKNLGFLTTLKSGSYFDLRNV